jgi:hypothetical protein
LRLVRGQPVLVQQLQHVVDDRVLGFGEEIRSGKAVSGIRAHRGDLPHIGDGRFFEGHAVAFRTLVAHGVTLSTSKVRAAARSLLVARKFP